EEARAERHATDVAFNTNGIRRCALAVMDARDRFRGVLALAEAFRFDAAVSPGPWLTALRQTAHQYLQPIP
ncbi:MAG: hypothetical protein AAGK14_14945, partial [Verrucomicrobiota bacterium]